MTKAPREFWITDWGGISESLTVRSKKPELGPIYSKEHIHVIEKSAYDVLTAELSSLKVECAKLREEAQSLSVKLQRTVSAAYHALLEMSAWMGIPEKRREAQITELMSNVKYCAEHDLRHVDASQVENALRADRDALVGKLAIAIEALEFYGWNYIEDRDIEKEPRFRKISTSYNENTRTVAFDDVTPTLNKLGKVARETLSRLREGGGE